MNADPFPETPATVTPPSICRANRCAIASPNPAPVWQRLIRGLHLLRRHNLEVNTIRLLPGEFICQVFGPGWKVCRVHGSEPECCGLALLPAELPLQGPGVDMHQERRAMRTNSGR